MKLINPATLTRVLRYAKTGVRHPDAPNWTPQYIATDGVCFPSQPRSSKQILEAAQVTATRVKEFEDFQSDLDEILKTIESCNLIQVVSGK